MTDVDGVGPDTGLSSERTALAWQRTALSIVIGAAVLGRLTVVQLGWITVALPGLASTLALWVFVQARWRYAPQLGLRPHMRRPDGRAAGSLTAATFLVAIALISTLAR